MRRSRVEAENRAYMVAPTRPTAEPTMAGLRRSGKAAEERNSLAAIVISN